MKRAKGGALALILALVLALLLSLSACEEKKPLTFRIGLALYSGDDTFITSVSQHLQQLAKAEEQERGIKINVSVADAERSQMMQNEQVDRFIQQGYDLICVNIVDRTAAAVIVDKAQQADTPVIFFNREPVEEDLERWEKAFYIGARGEEAGRMQGELMLSAWAERRPQADKNGDGILQYVMLEGEPGHQDTLLRSEYSVKTLTEAGLPIERLASAGADWQRGAAWEKMRQWLERFGETGIEAVFANNDDMALGAIDACLEAGMTLEELPLVVGVDATEKAVEAVQGGYMVGTVRNDAAGQAREIMDLFAKFLSGQEVEGHYVWLSYQPVSKEP